MGAVKILYIAGASFSGSTFLGAALSQHPDFCLAGELIGFLSHRPRGHKCSCGQRYDRCTFWKTVLQDWQRRSPAISLDEFRTISERYERIRAYPRLLSPNLTQQVDFQRYAAANHAFFAALAQAGQCSTIIDISKYPTRALALARAGLDVYCVHLVKNGLAYLDSDTRRRYRRRYQQRRFWPRWRFWVRSALEWDLINLLAEDVTRRLGGLRLRYEDYVADPAAAFARIGQALATDTLAPYGEQLRRGATISFDHALGGNLIRLQGETRLEPRTNWVARLSPTQKIIYALISGWLGRHYGYPLTPPASAKAKTPA